MEEELEAQEGGEESMGSVVPCEALITLWWAGISLKVGVRDCGLGVRWSGTERSIDGRMVQTSSPLAKREKKWKAFAHFYLFFST